MRGHIKKRKKELGSSNFKFPIVTFLFPKGRLHELKKGPFSGQISGPYVVNRPVLALKTGPFKAHVNAPQASATFNALQYSCSKATPLTSNTQVLLEHKQPGHIF